MGIKYNRAGCQAIPECHITKRGRESIKREKLQQPAQFRDVTRAHVIAWREQLVGQGLANDTIRRKLAALSSVYA